MVHQVILNIPDTAYSILKKSPQKFGEELLISALVLWYNDGIISQSKASEIANISRVDFLNALYKHNISPYQVDENELKREFEL